MSQDAPPVSRKDKKAQRDAERRKPGRKRKHAETVEEDEATAPSPTEDSVALTNRGETSDGGALKTAKTKATKRKRGLEDTADGDASEREAASAPVKAKKLKTVKGETATDEDGETGTAADDKSAKSRFILFIGNLPFDTTDASLQEHFKKLMPFTLRHRTDPKTKKSKGFAFLEFENYDRMKTCLKLYHHSMFDPAEAIQGGMGRGKSKGPRRINVELTAGGGGKAEGRKDKIRVKNVRLEDQRRRRLELEKKQKAGDERKNGAARKKQQAKGAPDVGAAPVEEDAGAMHPSRLARMTG